MYDICLSFIQISYYLLYKMSRVDSKLWFHSSFCWYTGIIKYSKLYIKITLKDYNVLFPEIVYCMKSKKYLFLIYCMYIDIIFICKDSMTVHFKNRKITLHHNQ